MKLAMVLMGIVTALGVAAIAFTLSFAGLYWWDLSSTRVFDRLEHDQLAALKLAWLDVSLYGEVMRSMISGGVALAAAAGVLLFAMKPKDNSDARFMDLAEATKFGLTRKGGVFVGTIGGTLAKIPGVFSERGSGRKRLAKPRILGGKKLWVDGDDVGGFVIGPPRSGKGAALIVPNCLLWPDSLVVLDMRGETYEATAGWRSKFSTVIRFSPADEYGDTARYNPLDFVSLDNDQRDIDINSIAAALLPTPKNDAYWIEDGRALFSGVVSWVLESKTVAPEDKNLGTVLTIISGADEPLRDWLEGVAGQDADRPAWIGRFTHSTLARFAAMAAKQFDGVYGSVMAAIKPFQNERILRATSESSFDIRSMRRDNVSLYLDFRIQQVRSIGPIFNILMTQFMDYMSRSMMKPGEKRILVLLDEFQNLGKLENALTVATVLGGYGVPTWFFVQSLRSIDNVYTREGRQTLVNAARAQIFLGAQDPDDQRYVSQLLGEREIVVVDESLSWTTFDVKRHKSRQKKHVMKPLMRPDELGSMPDDRCIIKLRNRQPIFGLRNFYYADPLLAKRSWQPLPQLRSKNVSQQSNSIVHELAAESDQIVLVGSEGKTKKAGARFGELAGQPHAEKHNSPAEVFQHRQTKRIPDFSKLVAQMTIPRTDDGIRVQNRIMQFMSRMSDPSPITKHANIIVECVDDIAEG